VSCWTPGWENKSYLGTSR